MDAHDIASGLAVLLALVSTVLTYRKKRGLSLTEIAVRAVGYAEQMGPGAYGKLNQALEAARKLDAGDNGRRDFTDPQLRVAIEAELARVTK